VRIIEDAFDQIKEVSNFIISKATGISSNDEIVTTFIKAEEQNYSLYNYVNTLNQETDSLEESNREIKEEIERYLAREKMNEKEKEQLINDLKDEVNEIMR
jgi:hypothetical protein